MGKSNPVEPRTLYYKEKQMGRPLSRQQLFSANAKNNIKVQFNNGSASVKGYILKQKSSKRFLCEDVDGNTALCYLKAKASGDLLEGEMSITVLDDTNTAYQITKITRHRVAYNNGIGAPWTFEADLTDGFVQMEEAGDNAAMDNSTDLEGDDAPAGYSWTAPSGWQGYEIFDGSTQRLSVPASSDWAPGTGAFTVEFVTNFQTGGGSFPRVFSVGSYPSASVACSIEGGDTPTIYFWVGGSYVTSVDTSGALFTGMPSFVNNFHHVVLQRDGSGICNIFIDGNLVTPSTDVSTDNITDTTSALAIAVEPQSPSGYDNYMKGYLTNFRWTNAAVYPNSSFPVMSAELTALAQTKLLLLMASNGALNTDSSAGAKTVTATGSPTWHTA